MQPRISECPKLYGSRSNGKLQDKEFENMEQHCNHIKEFVISSRDDSSTIERLLLLAPLARYIERS